MLEVATDPTESEHIPLSPALSAEIAAEFPPPTRTVLDRRTLSISLLAIGIAVAASDTRVAVAWVTGRTLGPDDPVGGYAIFACR